MSNTAALVKDLSGFRGHASLYRLDPPLVDPDYFGEGKDPHEFVIVSASDVPYSGPETYIFPADESGKITSWGELEGSFRGALDHAAALSGAGYSIS